jgi:hypothetical protein
VSETTSLLPSVRAGALKGLAILNKYYSKTDDSIMYRIAMSMFLTKQHLLSNLISLLVLNPKYKLSYFRAKDWEEEWIDAALKVLRDQWMTYYKHSQRQSTTIAMAQDPLAVSKSVVPIFLLTLTATVLPQDDPFAELDNFGSFSVEDELEEYLKAPPISTVLDPLGWWHTMGDTPLAWMGRDYMSAPGICAVCVLFNI